MRCEFLKLASVPSTGPDRLLSLAIQALDQPPPTASRTSEKVMLAWVHCEAAPRNSFLRVSTRAKMPASVRVGSSRAVPSRKALLMEKSHAS